MNRTETVFQIHTRLWTAETKPTTSARERWCVKLQKCDTVILVKENKLYRKLLFWLPIMLSFLVGGCSTLTDFEKLNSESLNQCGVVVAESHIEHHGEKVNSSLFARLRNMNKKNKSKFFGLSEGMQLAIVEPGRYQLNLIRMDAFPSWIMLHKKSDGFDVKAGEIVYLGRIFTDVYHPGWKEMLNDPVLWGSSLTSSMTGAVGHSVKVQFRVEDYGSNIRQDLARKLQIDPQKLSYKTQIIQQFSDASPFE